MIDANKTKNTIELEEYIYNKTKKDNTYGCHEVSVENNGRVDFMTYDSKEKIFSCYEIKSSRSDFCSNAKLTFVGHFNYYVLTKELYEKVIDLIPEEIGIYTIDGCMKKATKQELKISEDVLMDSFLNAYSRHFDKYYNLCKEDLVIKIKELERRYLKVYGNYLDLTQSAKKRYGKSWRTFI